MLSAQLDIQQHAEALEGRSAMTAAYATATDVETALARWQLIAAAAESEVDLVAQALVVENVADEHTVVIL